MLKQNLEGPYSQCPAPAEEDEELGSGRAVIKPVSSHVEDLEDKWLDTKIIG